MPHPIANHAECDNPFDTRYKPERILIFDMHPGGIGLAAAVGGRVDGWEGSRRGQGQEESGSGHLFM
jgi:hypothetical protein